MNTTPTLKLDQNFMVEADAPWRKLALFSKDYKFADGQKEAIVCAVNAYDDLLTAAKYAVEAFDNDIHRGDKFFNGENSAIARLKAALRKAESSR